jgi:hypothetical protein
MGSEWSSTETVKQPLCFIEMVI